MGITAAASPGAFQTFLISESLRGGWRRGMPVAFAPLVSDAPIVVAILLLLGRLPPLFLRGISLAGGIFVLYLAWGAWQNWRKGGGLSESETQNERRGLWRGAVMNLLSPGPYLFWSLVNGPLLLAALRQSPLHGGAFLVGFYGIFIGTMLAIVGVFHQARRLGPRAVRGLLWVSIGILFIFGGALIQRAIEG